MSAGNVVGSNLTKIDSAIDDVCFKFPKDEEMKFSLQRE